MQTKEARILTINGGSSSIKFAIFDARESLHRICGGTIDRIGLPNAAMRIEGTRVEEEVSDSVSAIDYAAATGMMLDWIEQRLGNHALTAVGHRVVHGGPNFGQPRRIDPGMMEELRRISPFAPEHLPGELQLIDALADHFPGLPQVACFDTAFFHDLPRVAQLLPIPRRYHEQGIRRYGFHGLSYAFLLETLRRLAGSNAANGRVILAHLGNGASIAAIHHGRPIDTSMGFTPTAGVPMSTRAGDLDPGLISYLLRTEQMSEQELSDMVNLQSGLLGVSETSSDMRDLLQREAQDIRAADAVALFCYEVKKRIGGYAAALGGLDTLVFAGGIGEHSPIVRQRICEGLSFLGIELSAARNAEATGLISSDASRVTVRVIATDEEQMIGEMVCRVLAND